ncbi:hypothetical protein ACP4OV_031956 [Aristida adscensionis]
MGLTSPYLSPVNCSRRQRSSSGWACIRVRSLLDGNFNFG